MENSAQAIKSSKVWKYTLSNCQKVCNYKAPHLQMANKKMMIRLYGCEGFDVNICSKETTY